MKEWENEPNWLEFEHAGLNCLVVRDSALKHLNGYVCVPEGHPYYGKRHKDVNVSAHRGLSFSAQFWDEVEERWKDGWWFGFDCEQPGDLVPAKGNQTENDVYRNIDYVKNEVKKLAEQLAAISPPKEKKVTIIDKILRRFKE
jgi:hypothetical protein